MRSLWIILVVAIAGVAMPGPRALGQNPVQWQANVPAAVANAKEQMLPLLVWVSSSTDIGEDDDLKDAEEESFRDPVVVEIVRKHYIPLRVYRNSRSVAQLESLGLPGNFALYLAIVSPGGKALDQIDPGQIVRPEALARRLAAASQAYRDGVYDAELKKIITDPAAKKSDVRAALRAVWRLEILSADKDVIAILDRADLTPTERRRLYAMIAGLGTRACVEALLKAAETDEEAARALVKSEAGALATLVEALPSCGKTPGNRELAAYRATVSIARAGTPRPDAFWTESSPELCQKELDRVRNKAESVLAYWTERQAR